MTLEMYLDGKLLDSVVLLPGDLQSEKTMHLHIRSLQARHHELIAKSGKEPSFLLCGINSSMNYFTPLIKQKTDKDSHQL